MLARKEKNSAFWIYWEIELNWASGQHCEPLGGFSGGPGGKVFGSFIVFSLKLI